MKKWALLILTGLLVLATAIPAGAGMPTPRLVINGKEVMAPAGEKGVHLHDARMYVGAKEFASAIGATYSVAENGNVTIRTGSDLPTVAELTKINPKLSLYQGLSPFIPSMGVHQGVMGPHVTLAVSKGGAVNAFELIVPEAAGWQPWFDQPEGQAMELEGLGKVYTQHIYVTNPQGIMDLGIDVTLNGRFLSYNWEPKPHLHDNKPYIPARAAVEALGGSISWNGQTWTATAEVKPNRLTWNELLKLNPKLSAYQAISPFIPGMGIHMGARGAHLTVVVDNAGYVTGFELVQPAAGIPWMPWFDQAEGQVFELEGLGQVWTQHIYIVDPATIK